MYVSFPIEGDTGMWRHAWNSLKTDQEQNSCTLYLTPLKIPCRFKNSFEALHTLSDGKCIVHFVFNMNNLKRRTFSTMLNRQSVGVS